MIAAAALACAIALPATLNMESVVRVESGGNEIAINVNHAPGKPAIGAQHPTSVEDAAAIAHRYIALGYTVDIGAAQVNSSHLSDDLTVEQLLDPCTNVRVGSSILAADYRQAVQQGYGPDQASLVALSYFNTGTALDGFANGYVARYGRTIDASFRPAMAQAGASGRKETEKGILGQNRTKYAAPDPYTADGVVYLGVKINVPIE